MGKLEKAGIVVLLVLALFGAGILVGYLWQGKHHAEALQRSAEKQAEVLGKLRETEQKLDDALKAARKTIREAKGPCLDERAHDSVLRLLPHRPAGPKTDR